MSRREAFDLVKATLSAYGGDNASRLGAAIPYYPVFALAPLLVLTISVAGLVYGQEAVRGQVVDQISGLVGENAAELIQSMLAAGSDKSMGLLATSLGTITLLLGASSMFMELKSALNTIWKVQPKQAQGILQIVKDHLLAVVIALSMGFLLLVSMVASAAISGLTGFFQLYLPVPTLALHAVDMALSVVVLTLAFAIIFKGLPDTRIAWSDIWAGAILTGVLFTIGKFAIGLYLGHAVPASSFGAAGALVLLLLWIYYSAQIFFLGAEFTRVYAKRHGSRAEAGPHAVATPSVAQPPTGPHPRLSM